MNFTRKLLGLTLSCLLLVGFTAGCSGKVDPKSESPENGVVLNTGDTVALMEIKGFGTIKIKLMPDVAPKAVENFTTHAKNGYYDNLTFHRVIADFMIQGGDPSGNGTGGESIWGESFEDEFSDSARNFTGALSMANAGPNTNGSQFFIVKTPPLDAGMVELTSQSTGVQYSEEDTKTYTERGGTPHLDNVHTVFGMVYEGMEIVDKIMAVETAEDGSDKPVKPVTIKSIIIETIA